MNSQVFDRTMLMLFLIVVSIATAIDANAQSVRRGASSLSGKNPISEDDALKILRSTKFVPAKIRDFPESVQSMTRAFSQTTYRRQGEAAEHLAPL